MVTILADQLSLYLTSRYPNAVVSDINFLVSGFESEIYTFQLQQVHSSQRNYVLRLFTGEGATEKLTREAKGLDLLQSVGYPVPALFLQETDAGILGKPFEIIQRLEGQSLWPVLAAAEPDQQSQLLSKFGALLAQLHQLDWLFFSDNPHRYEESPTRLIDETISHYRSLYTKFNLKGFIQLVNWLDQHKHEITVCPAVVHQDFHANNVYLCSDDQLFVIDWTQFAVSDYRVDLAWSMLIMGDFGNPDWGRQIWNAYASNVNHPIEHFDYFRVIVSMKLLASTVISFTYSPEELGLRPETSQVTKEQASIYKQLSRQIQTITGVIAPELEEMLKKV